MTKLGPAAKFVEEDTELKVCVDGTEPTIVNIEFNTHTNILTIHTEEQY